ncbi:hypothetical protein LZ30DRAFT_826016 [Colletotrichum cereale]|nr:hypothetical protein LZ30DRAFT_826016 [Colletotrichum cereale]
MMLVMVLVMILVMILVHDSSLVVSQGGRERKRVERKKRVLSGCIHYLFLPPGCDAQVEPRPSHWDCKPLAVKFKSADRHAPSSGLGPWQFCAESGRECGREREREAGGGRFIHRP